MVNRVREWRHSRTWESPAEASGDDVAEGPNVVFLELSLFAVVTDAGDDVIVIVPVEHPVDFEPLFIKLFTVPLNICDQDCVLKLIQLLIIPQEWHICEIYNVQVWLPEACFSFGFLVPEEDDQCEVLSIVMSLEDLWVLVIQGGHFG